MLPIDSHSLHQKRSFSKVRSTPLSVKFVVFFVLYCISFGIGFFGFYQLKTHQINEMGHMRRYRMPSVTRDHSLRDLLSLGDAVKGENPLIQSAKYIQHLFLERMRIYRREHPHIYAYDVQTMTEHDAPGSDTSLTTTGSSQDSPFPLKVHQPTKKQFLSHVRKGAPIILTGVVDKWKAFNEWTDEYLTKKIGHVKIPIEYSETQNFYGDASRQKLQDFSVADFLREYRKPDRTKNYYLAETSILKNFKPLLNDFPRTPYFIPDSWTLDVIQLWIGAGGQITPSHNDEAENILCQFQGGRTFYVYDPFWVDLLYTSAENPVYPRVKVRETTPNYKNYPLFRKARAPLELRINEGECLYLPSTWYHRVESKPDTRSLAINYWYHPQSSIGELLWVSMSSHEWATAEGELKMGRKRGEQN
eukprot:CAMPEP_0117445020 /NCGR_PEP_ID=MMETSP0759-20121206/5563_1 /TAXON_ID=63605 /ORGANISM="Percolomonas cosmopolitus, Strain WS" /LENGTH=417 /DNA_ID=CAMNT_0005237149 /DNA_START=586 /DNA_END=1839 /DNA_ORIENTATION=-